MAYTYTQNYEVSLVPGKLPKPVVTFSQNDTGLRILTFHLCEEVELSKEGYLYSYYLQGKKPNGLGFQVSGSYDASTRLFSFTVNDALTECSGLFEAEISINRQLSPSVVPNNEVIGTANILLNVEQSPHPKGTHDGTAEEIEDYLEELLEAYELAKTKTEKLASEAVASATTVTEKAEEIENFYSQMVTEKLEHFISLDATEGFPSIDWASSAVYRTGDRIHGQLKLSGIATDSLTLEYTNEDYKPQDNSVLGVLFDSINEVQTYYVIQAQTSLKLGKAGDSLTLLLDYTISTVNTYEDGDELEY